MHENRETSGAPRPERERGRSAKAQSHTADAHALEESDRAILSLNQTNKEERSSAEPGEKRARAKENIVQSDTSPTCQSRMKIPHFAGRKFPTPEAYKAASLASDAVEPSAVLWRVLGVTESEAKELDAARSCSRAGTSPALRRSFNR